MTKKIILWLILLFPIAFFLELIFDIPTLTTYVDFWKVLRNFIQMFWDWMIIIGVSIVLSKKLQHIKNETKEQYRLKFFLHESQRWANTPFISPLFYYYLINPLSSYSNLQRDVIGNKFYVTTLNLFRDRIFINAHYTEKHPLERKPLWEVIGKKELIKVFSILYGCFIWVMVVTVHDYSRWLYGWERFTIPFLVYYSLYFSLKMQAYLEMSYKDMDAKLTEYYGEEVPHIRWRELMPEEPKGQTILQAWYAEVERRQRYSGATHPLSGVHIPYPFPSAHSPDWVEQMDLFFEEKEKEWINNVQVSGENIVMFPKRN